MSAKLTIDRPSRSPTLTLTLFITLVGFTTGCGLAQFKIPGYRSLGAILAALLLSIATFVWFRADSFQRSYRRSTSLDIAFVGLTLFVLPYYLIRSRGLKTGIMAIGVGIAMYFLYVLAALVGIVFIRAVHV